MTYGLITLNLKVITLTSNNLNDLRVNNPKPQSNKLNFNNNKTTTKQQQNNNRTIPKTPKTSTTNNNKQVLLLLL
jgi:hypothetical protein